MLDHRGIDVLVEGVQRVSGLKLIGSGKQTDLVPGGFNATVQVNLVVSSTDGILDFRFRGSGGNPFFVINGLRLVRREASVVAGLCSVPATLRAGTEACRHCQLTAIVAPIRASGTAVLDAFSFWMTYGSFHPVERR